MHHPTPQRHSTPLRQLLDHVHYLEAQQATEFTRLTSVQHDAVLDYYGRKLATCSSDKTIKIFEIEGESQRLTDTLKGCVTSTIYPARLASGLLQLQDADKFYFQPRGSRMVRCVGSPQVWQYPGLCGLRRQGLHLAGTVIAVAAYFRLPTPQGFRKHRVLVTTRDGLPAGLCLI